MARKRRKARAYDLKGREQSINRVDDFIPGIVFWPATHSFSECERELGFEQSMWKTPARDCGRALEYIIFEHGTVGRSEIPSRACTSLEVAPTFQPAILSGHSAVTICWIV
jgi:hypothetical protein